MKKITSALLIFFAFTTAVIAQNKQEQKVANAVEQLRKAMISGNRNDLNNIASDNLDYGHSSGKVQNKTEFVEAIASGVSDFVTVNLTEQTIKITDKTAIVRHKLQAATNDNGKPGVVNLGIMLVFEREHGNWKLLARQAYKL